LWKLEYQVTGLDLSASLLASARRKYPEIEFTQADVRSLPFETGTFDQALFSFNGLGHVYPAAEFRRALAEIARVLKPGGIFIYSGHNIIGRFGRYACPVSNFLMRGLPDITKTIIWQFRGSLPWRWYWRYKEAFGDIVVFSAPPWVHKKLHRLTGFETLDLVGGLFQPNRRSETWLTLREHHIHYVLRRKA
jgi:ubiquinone/menaquinone biosynthesis C-methylase UbiE